MIRKLVEAYSDKVNFSRIYEEYMVLNAPVFIKAKKSSQLAPKEETQTRLDRKRWIEDVDLSS